MYAAAQSTPEIHPAHCDREVQSELIRALISDGDRDVDLGNDAEAISSYYTIFQPDLYGNSVFGLRRVAPMERYLQAAKKLRMVASRYAARLVANRFFLAGDSASGIVGVPRGALNLYLISNQYDVFADEALRCAAEEFGRRDIKRFLMSSVRARLSHLESVQACATLLDEEQDAFPKLAKFELRLHAHRARLHACRKS